MLQKLHKSPTIKYLILYLIMSLLFVVSVKLHIHTGDTADYSSHGSSVAVSSIDHLASTDHQLFGETEVSPDKFLNKITASIAVAIIIPASLVVFPVYRYCASVFSETDETITSLPFAGTPPLRAPPR
jgi:preprotein translocase subunit SecG